MQNLQVHHIQFRSQSGSDIAIFSIRLAFVIWTTDPHDMSLLVIPLLVISTHLNFTGVEFPDAWNKRVASTFFGVPVYFLSLDDLVANKQALGRSSDVKDLKRASGGAKVKHSSQQ